MAIEATPFSQDLKFILAFEYHLVFIHVFASSVAQAGSSSHVVDFLCFTDTPCKSPVDKEVKESDPKKP